MVEGKTDNLKQWANKNTCSSVFVKKNSHNPAISIVEWTNINFLIHIVKWTNHEVNKILIYSCQSIYIPLSTDLNDFYQIINEVFSFLLCMWIHANNHLLIKYCIIVIFLRCTLQGFVIIKEVTKITCTCSTSFNIQVFQDPRTLPKMALLACRLHSNIENPQ